MLPALRFARPVIDAGDRIADHPRVFDDGSFDRPRLRQLLPLRRRKQIHPHSPSMTLLEIAEALGAKLPPAADPNFAITGAASLEDAQPTDVAFFEHPKYVKALRATRAGVVLVPSTFEEPLSTITVHVPSPSAAFSVILEKLAKPEVGPPPGIHPTAVVHPSAIVDPTACIHPFAVIEPDVVIGAEVSIGAHAFVGRDARIGPGSVVHPHVVLYRRTILGARVTIHSGAVIGSDGFGYRMENGRHEKVVHRGHVQIDDDVEVGAGTTIDRARFGRTWIQTGTKIDNLVQIAHNVVIGPHCLIIAQTGISGSARLGKYVVLAGQVGVVGHIEIGDQVVVAAKSGVSKDAPAGQTLMGMFGVPMKEARELVAHYHRLPKTVAKIKKLEDEVEELKRLVAELTNGRQDEPDPA
jgi:UDP-3-O-[3-hydroxymyristoyl] glucosamine N-acyltransferase